MLSFSFADLRHFNPRSPWGERRCILFIYIASVGISIHAPRGGSDLIFRAKLGNAFLISIHAPRGGSDLGLDRNFISGIQFQSTLPVGGATLSGKSLMLGNLISIHAPRGGSDIFLETLVLSVRHFNPRSPWGERQRLEFTIYDRLIFQSTLPVGGATMRFSTVLTGKIISIHAPRGGSDNIAGNVITRLPDFNPRSPWGERPFQCFQIIRFGTFQSTLPVGGATGLS